MRVCMHYGHVYVYRSICMIEFYQKRLPCLFNQHWNWHKSIKPNITSEWFCTFNSIQFNSIQNMFIVQCTASIQNSISYHNQGWVLQQYLKIRHTRQALSRGNTVSVQMISRVISKKAIYSHKSNSPRHSGRGSAGHSVPRALWYVNTSWRR